MLTFHKEIIRKRMERTVRWILELPPISCSVIKIHGFSIPIQPYLPIEYFIPKPREPVAFKPLEQVVSKPIRPLVLDWANFDAQLLYPTGIVGRIQKLFYLEMRKARRRNLYNVTTTFIQ